MKHATKLSMGAALAGAVVVIGGGVSVAATSGQDTPAETDISITGDALEQASAAALAVTGRGAVTDTEVDDEESRYEVEVTLPDGSQVDVQLDGSFNLVETIPDLDTRE